MPFIDLNVNGQGPFLDDPAYWNQFSGKAAIYGVRSGTMPGYAILFIDETPDLAAALAALVNNKSHCIHNYLPMDVLVEDMTNIDVNLRRQRARDLIDEYRPPCNLR